ncbi:hypothetical protein HELRODRAFT_178867 [Helobdella robusta]|uniref:alpha-1,2-Mannosidase n=1 Tax=Helobdella robusta TaxID=6412 RepID=T1FDU3_HELRO|nr:hypothetical protein HELRODRAFT_178867 [Helobdella robusta]ESN95949.1 hypothetical protein HELRODRAFT_178867 [Helobdella robusta]
MSGMKIVSAFRHAWLAYKRYAWGKDELNSLSKKGSDWMGVGLTIVDSLDTLLIMGLNDEYKEARDWVVNSLKTDQTMSIQLFEITIRLLGGLLSAYHLSGDKALLNKASHVHILMHAWADCNHVIFDPAQIEFGDALFVCFGGSNPLPANKVVIKSRRAEFGQTNLAEVGSLQLEFRDLSRASGDSKYEKAAWKVSEYLRGLKKFDGLAPTTFDSSSAFFSEYAPITMGGMADSYYEYLLKQWLQTGQTIDWLKEDYISAYNGVKKHLLKQSDLGKHWFIGTMPSMKDTHSANDVMDHLTCFYPGNLALAYMSGLPAEMLKTAKDVVETCYIMYKQTPTKLSPESVSFQNRAGEPFGPNVHEPDFFVDFGSAYNIHRPEAVESLYYLYKATKDPKYKQWAWDIFEAFENVTKLDEGYAGVQNVMQADRKSITYLDKMETFYLAETLKYLYLLFSDDESLLPVDRWVFNTEAHPLPVFKN